jgi:hypothetical protein
VAIAALMAPTVRWQSEHQSAVCSGGGEKVEGLVGRRVTMGICFGEINLPLKRRKRGSGRSARTARELSNVSRLALFKDLKFLGDVDIFLVTYFASVEITDGGREIEF